MATSISATGAKDVTTALFNKLDTRQKGYIDQADLEAALGPDQAQQGKAGAVLAQLDGDRDGRVTKSELSTAIEKVGQQLSAQQDQSRVAKAGGAPPARGGSGPPPPKAEAASTDEENKYVAAADSNGDGTVSEAEQAAYEKLLAAAQAKAQLQANAYTRFADAETGAASSVDVSA